MSTKGVVDIVFCVDASDSMRPCIDAVRRHAIEFIKGLEAGQQQMKMDWRIDFVAHSCDQSGGPIRLQTLHHAEDLTGALYGNRQGSFFTQDLGQFQEALNGIEVFGDEATLIALDFALDFPWRPRQQCHRVVICLSDEPFESGALIPEQLAHLPALVQKIQDLGVLLFLVAPLSDAFATLSEADKCEYQVADQANDGLRSLDFALVLSSIGKSVSVANLQVSAEHPVPRALFGQDRWGVSDKPIRGR